MESELPEPLGVPKEIKFGAMIPIGRPHNDFVKINQNQRSGFAARHLLALNPFEE
jgi:hypothetical protein